MTAEKIPTYYKGLYVSHIRNKNGQLVPCTVYDGDGQGKPFEIMMFALFMAGVAVDATTGNVQVEKFTLISDVGKINNRFAETSSGNSAAPRVAAGGTANVTGGMRAPGEG